MTAIHAIIQTPFHIQPPSPLFPSPNPIAPVSVPRPNSTYTRLQMNHHIFLFPIALIACLTLASGQADDDDVTPAPPSIGADVPLAYFGPAPSTVDKRLVGPVQLLRSGTIDFDAGTITIPLYYGTYSDGEGHYYILTDTTDPTNAAALGLNHSPKLEYVTEESGTTARLAKNAQLVNRKGKVNFSPTRRLVPANEPAPFPPRVFVPGQVGDANYSPFVRITNVGDRVYNAPIVASGVSENVLNQYCDGFANNRERKQALKKLHSKVVRICPREQTVTLELVAGFSFAKPIFYLSMEASDRLPAAFEDTTFAPRLANIQVGFDDSAFSPVERLFATVNGFGNTDLAKGAPAGETVHPSRQGFFSAIRGEGSPLNVLGGIPTVATDYSPAWDLNVGEWTKFAVDTGIRCRLIEEFQILAFAERGYITAPGGGRYGSSGFIVNCPIVHRFL